MHQTEAASSKEEAVPGFDRAIDRLVDRRSMPTPQLRSLALGTNVDVEEIPWQRLSL